MQLSPLNIEIIIKEHVPNKQIRPPHECLCDLVFSRCDGEHSAVTLALTELFIPERGIGQV